MKLLIISNMSHYLDAGRVVGWGPTVQEIDHLANIFDEIRHIGFLHADPPPLNALPYSSPKVHLVPVPPAGGEKLSDKLKILNLIPLYLRTILQELPWADAVHVRCPANLPLMAVVLLSLVPFPKYRWVKYAGNWRPNGRESWSYTIQRWMLQKNLHRGVVTVNGRWPQQPAHIFSFLNPSLTEEEASQPHPGPAKKFGPPYQLLFVGRVEASKGAGRVLQMAELLEDQGLDFVLHMVGDGPEKAAWAEWSRVHGLDARVTFHGWLPKPALTDFYSKAHFMVLPSSASEGWPKVLSEAMAYGAVPLAGAVSCIPQILAETGAGMALPPLDSIAFYKTLLDYVARPDRWRAASRASMAAAANFTYDHYLQAVRQMFATAWAISL